MLDIRRASGWKHRPRPGLGRPWAQFRARVEILACGVVIGVPILAPFPLGSVEWPWMALWGVVLAAAVPWLRVEALTSGQVKILSGVLGAATVLGLYILFQATGWGGLLPENRLYTEARALLNEPFPGVPSAMPTQSLAVSGGLALGLLAFAAAYVVGADPHRARMLCIAVAVSTIVNGALGYVLFKLDPTQLLWNTFANPRGQPSGTFIIRNHAATLFATGAITFFTIALRRVLDVVPRGLTPWRAWSSGLLASKPPRIGLPLLAFAACVAFALATGSRGGLAALALGMAAVAAFVVLPALGLRVGLSLFLACACFIVVVSAPLIGASSVGERLEAQTWSQDGRWEIYEATVRMIRDHPWFGIGLGAFEHVIPRYKPDTIPPTWIWDYAHSGPLQLVAELGLPAGLFGIAILLGVIGLCAAGTLLRRRDLDLPAIGTGVGLVGLIHGSFDFSLQIPGYMLVYASVLGACTAQALPTRGKKMSSPHEGGSRPTAPGHLSRNSGQVVRSASGQSPVRR